MVMRSLYLLIFFIGTFPITLKAQETFETTQSSGIILDQTRTPEAWCDESGIVHVLVVDHSRTVSIISKRPDQQTWAVQSLDPVGFGLGKTVFHMNENGNGCLAWSTNTTIQLFTRSPGMEWVEVSGSFNNHGLSPYDSYFDCAINRQGEVLFVWSDQELNSYFKDRNGSTTDLTIPFNLDEDSDIRDLQLLLTDDSVGQLFFIEEDLSDSDITAEALAQIRYANRSWGTESRILPRRVGGYEISDLALDHGTDRAVLLLEKKTEPFIDSTLIDAGVYFATFNAGQTPVFDKISAKSYASYETHPEYQVAIASSLGQSFGSGIYLSQSEDTMNQQCLIVDEALNTNVQLENSGPIEMDIATSSSAEQSSIIGYFNQAAHSYEVMGAVKFEDQTDTQLLFSELKTTGFYSTPAVSVASCSNGGATFVMRAPKSGELLWVDYLSPDRCPLDPLKTTPGHCGCGVQDRDENQNGIFDCNVNLELRALAKSLKSAVKKERKKALKLSKSFSVYVRTNLSLFTLTKSDRAVELNNISKRIFSLVKKLIGAKDKKAKTLILKSLKRLNLLLSE